MLVALKCPCCGGGVDRTSLTCEYCGTEVTLSSDGTRASGSNPRKCPTCGNAVFEGTQFCAQCATVFDASQTLIRRAQKARFSQDKYRRSFIPEISTAFHADEMVLADTYGPNAWYVVTTQRLLICKVRTGWLSKKLEGAQKMIQLDNITKLTRFSRVWWKGGDVLTQPPLMNLQIETFNGDLDICVYASKEKAPYYKDPYYWLARLEDAIGLVEEGTKHPIYILYRLSMTQDFAPGYSSPLVGQTEALESSASRQIRTCPTCQSQLGATARQCGVCGRRL